MAKENKRKENGDSIYKHKVTTFKVCSKKGKGRAETIGDLFPQLPQFLMWFGKSVLEESFDRNRVGNRTAPV